EIVEGNFEFLRDREGIVALRHDVGLGRVMFWRAVLRWFRAIGFPFFNRDGFRRRMRGNGFLASRRGGNGRARGGGFRFRRSRRRVRGGDRRRKRTLPRLDRVERDDARDGDDVKDELDEKRARQLHVRLGHFFVIHFVGRAERAPGRGRAQRFAGEKLG